MKVKATRLFEETYNATTRIIVHEGGTRSSKTYSIAQNYIIGCMNKWNNKIITICRKTMPSLRITAMRDFFDILKEYDIYNESLHNKTENSYELYGNLVEFFSLDQPQKKRGAKRHYLWMNEANEFTLEDYRQMMMRTECQSILDYNPSDFFHWIYDDVLTRDDVTFIHSTYLDNPFLSESQIKEIELLKKTDPDYWKIYGEGKRASIRGLIYHNWKEVKDFPDECKMVFYGMDFGYTNDVTSFVKIGLKEGELYVQELFYERGLTNNDISDKLKVLGIDKSSEIFADSSEPKSIDEIHSFGWNVKGAKKGKDSIVKGIDIIKRYNINVISSSINTIKELKSYKWKVDKDDKPLNEPIDMWNHSLDALRYGCSMKLIQPDGKFLGFGLIR